MKASATGFEVGGKSDTILIFGLLAAAGIVLWKSGIFKTLKGATQLVDTATAAAGTVVTDVVNLPSNIVTLASDIPQVITAYYSITNPITQQSIFNNAIKGKATGIINQRTANMIQAVYKRYAGVTCANWSAMAVCNGAKFDSNGHITGDQTLSKGLPQAWPIARD
jgi:hypothetical protein